MRKTDKISRNNKGFTLIDVSVVLLIMGLIVAPMLKAVDIKYRNKRISHTKISLLKANIAIEQYYLLNGDYPCPADPTLPPGNINYGLSVSPCDAPGDPDPAVGAIPFKDLKIPIRNTIDGYGNKLSYSVSKNITNFGAPGFTTTGTLNLQSRKEDNSITNDFQGHYILISHGENGVGTFTADGIALAACAPGALQESENCDNDVNFIHHDFNVTLVNGANYYDDRVWFQKGAPTRIWSNSSMDVNDILSTAGLIGIGTITPEVALDVEGNIRTENGNANAKDICEGSNVNDTTNCFQASDIAGGPGTGINCPGSVMTGISNGDADCNLGIASVAMNNNNCPANEYVWAISAGGVLSCKPF